MKQLGKQAVSRLLLVCFLQVIGTLKTQGVRTAGLGKREQTFHQSPESVAHALEEDLGTLVSVTVQNGTSTTISIVTSTNTNSKFKVC